MSINLLVAENSHSFECEDDDYESDDEDYEEEEEEDDYDDTDTIDRISMLTDEILATILSYLPTKEAVATSILSKRWQHLWKLTSQVDISDEFLLDCENKEEKDCTVKFKEYVESVIFHHHGSNIRKCHFHFSTEQVAPHIYSWICAVINWNIQELFLSWEPQIFQPFDFHPLPWRIFSCNTLVLLKIQGAFVLDVPTYVCFPCLKSLIMKRCFIADDASMERLLSGCPVLESLCITRVVDSGQFMNICIPSLKSLIIGGVGVTQTVICCPFLEFLTIIDTEPGFYSINFTSSLIGTTLYNAFDVFLLDRISQSEALYLCLEGNSESLSGIISDSALPSFKNIQSLNLLLGKSVSWELLPNLLESTPNLLLLIFQEGLVKPTTDGNFERFEWQRPEAVPKCLSTRVKRVEISEFVGFPEELELVEYLLETCKVLETMIINHRSEYTKRPKMLEEKNEGVGVMHDISRFKRSCSTCQVIFSYVVGSPGKRMYWRM